MNSSTSDLGLLKRDKKLFERYNIWTEQIKAKYGSMGEYGLCLKPEAYLPF